MRPEGAYVVCLGCGASPDFPIAEQPCQYRHATNGTEAYDRCLEHVRRVPVRFRRTRKRALSTRQLQRVAEVLRNGIDTVDDLACELGVAPSNLRQLLSRHARESRAVTKAVAQ
jgi:hypothetical protein